ncbi:hypothetical protein O0I10_007432 [Lichtheimia ornata]|uniref:Treslin N-terminal domain-containing protein n=1 Tax=Lichtheimia ornata TaxID=688661 RepID=A0AAD7V226_9FUNG|nr:uncharacterized protein O0I10_007432 [Lichtheimia ornata]KAJ8656835.1 hypothetical protein O0I10_007432 [Lichtheimia ornata]
MTPIKRSAPHVVFLIDVVQQYENGHDATVRWIQGMVLRILLYFLDSVDKRTTWGYRFFNSKTRSIAMTNQSFHPISTKTVHEFANEFSKRIKNEHDPSSKAVDAPFTVVTRSLVQALAEFHWSDIDLSSESPRRQWSNSAASRGMQKIDIKNYTYLLTPAPHSLEALQRYMPSHSTINSNEDTDVNDQLAQWLQLMHSELRKWLWEDYANHRISLSWVDTGSFIGNSEELLLCNGLGSILRPFGGTHIRSSMLMSHFGSYGVSFSEVFHGCTPRTVNVGIDTISGKSTQELLGLKEEMQSWTVDLVQGSKEEQPSKIKVYPATSKPSRDLSIEQLDVVHYIHRCQWNMSWVEYPSSEEEDIFVLESTDNKCSSLIDDLRAKRQLAISRIVGNKEFYAVIEPKINNTAILRILAPSFQLSHITDMENLTPAKKRTFESTMLDYISLPATHAKKARLVDLLQDTSNESLKLASLSETKQQLLVDIKNRRRNRKGRLEAVVEAKLQSQSQPATPPPIHAEPASSFELPKSAQELRDTLRQIYLETIYTQKWLLIDSMKQMYECMEHVLEKTKGGTRLNEVTSAVRSLLYLSSEFDTKHNNTIVGNREEDLPEDERSYFSEWRAYTMRTGNEDHASSWRKALKIREGKMQMVLYLLSICLERRSGRLSITQSQKELKGEVDLENPMLEYQLCIYYDRSGVWEQVYDVGTFFQDLEQNEMGGPGFRIDPADVSLATFFHHMHQSISNAAIDWTQFLVDRSVEDEPSETQSLSSQITSSQMSTTSFWEPSSPPDMLSSQRSTKSKNMDDASSHTKKRSAMPDLPFMRREVDLSKRKNIPERIASASSAKPSMRRANSFTQPPISSQPRKARFNASQDQDSVLVKLREPLSPTTPRTRFERDFGFSMSGLGFTPHRHETQSPSNRRQVAMAAEEQDDVDDEITEARTPRRVRRLMMTPTRMRNEATAPHRRPRRNLTESLMAASTTIMSTTETFGQEEEDDLDGLFDDPNPIPVFGDILSDEEDDLFK